MPIKKSLMPIVPRRKKCSKIYKRTKSTKRVQAEVMVNMDRCIRRFTPTAAKMFGLGQTDVGRPISDINPIFAGPDLGPLAVEVIKIGLSKEINIQDRKGNWFRLQIHPHKTTGNKIDGASLHS